MVHFQIYILIRFSVKQGSRYLFLSKNYFIHEANRQIRLHFGGLLMSTFKWVKIHIMQPCAKKVSPYLMWSKNQEKSRSNHLLAVVKMRRHICAIFRACSALLCQWTSKHWCTLSKMFLIFRQISIYRFCAISLRELFVCAKYNNAFSNYVWQGYQKF